MKASDLFWSLVALGAVIVSHVFFILAITEVIMFETQFWASACFTLVVLFWSCVLGMAGVIIVCFFNDWINKVFSNEKKSPDFSGQQKDFSDEKG